MSCKESKVGLNGDNATARSGVPVFATVREPSLLLINVLMRKRAHKDDTHDTAVQLNSGFHLVLMFIWAATSVLPVWLSGDGLARDLSGRYS